MMEFWYNGEVGGRGISRHQTPLDLMREVHPFFIQISRGGGETLYHVPASANSIGTTYVWVDPDPLIEAMLLKQFSLKSTSET